MRTLQATVEACGKERKKERNEFPVMKELHPRTVQQAASLGYDYNYYFMQMIWYWVDEMAEPELLKRREKLLRCQCSKNENSVVSFSPRCWWEAGWSFVVLQNREIASQRSPKHLKKLLLVLKYKIQLKKKHKLAPYSPETLITFEKTLFSSLCTRVWHRCVLTPLA